jgi:molecular chaperone GrpE (heat shock protein)
MDFTQKLQDLMHRVNISSFKALSRNAGVSERQILRLRRFGVEQIKVDVLLRLSQTLQVSLNELVTNFSQVDLIRDEGAPSRELLQRISDLEKEYHRSQSELQHQRQLVVEQFQRSSLQLLESLLVQLPTAAHKARENPQLPAINILPLVLKPLEKLLQEWGVEAIASVGAEVPYDPQRHQLTKGSAQPGDIVKVSHIGYCQGGKLLYRAKVAPI